MWARISTFVPAISVGLLADCRRREMVSHPTGTTVRAINIFNTLPVRKQTAEKHSTKTLTKIRTLVDAYIIAHRNIRISLKVPKSKFNKFNFTYAPGARGATFKDTAMKLFGRDCANECIESQYFDDGFKFELFCPRYGSDVSKISGIGYFLSIDSRPVSTRAGTLRDIVAKYRQKIKQHDRLFREVKEPFLCLNIICPAGSYDPNVEPLKNVIFGDAKTILEVTDRCFSMLYLPQQESVAENVSTENVATATDLELEQKSTNDERIDLFASEQQHGSQSSILTFNMGHSKAPNYVIHSTTESHIYSDLSSRSPSLSPKSTFWSEVIEENHLPSFDRRSNIFDNKDSNEESLPLLSKLPDYVEINMGSDYTPNIGLNPWVLAKLASPVRPSMSYGFSPNISEKTEQQAREEPLRSIIQQSAQSPSLHEQPDLRPQGCQSSPHALVTNMSFLKKYRVLEHCSSQLLTPVASSSPNEHASNLLYVRSSPAYRYQTRHMKKNRFTDSMLAPDMSPIDAIPRERRKNRDIRSMLPGRETSSPEQKTRGRSQNPSDSWPERASWRGQGASVGVYDETKSSSPVVRTVTVPPLTSMADHIQSDRTAVNARFQAELYLKDSSNGQMALSTNNTFRSPMPLANVNCDGPERSVDALFQSPVSPEKRTRTIDAPSRDQSRAHLCRSLSHSRCGGETHGHCVTILGKDVLALINHAYEHLTDGDVLPWMPVAEVPFLYDMLEVCKELAMLWTPTICSLIQDNYPESRAVGELESEIARGLLQAHVLEME